jgi:1-acyl-sn-glycerol-3-phosphate acyltransferase
MIAARKHALFNLVLRPFLSWTLRRRFHNVYVKGGEHLRSLEPGSPVVGCANHSNWWDGFVLYVLSYRLLPHEIYLAMEEANLKRYPFFTWMGVFGVGLTGPRSALSGLRYAARLLLIRSESEAAPLVWIFVQGRLLAAGTQIEAKPGALWLAQKTGAQILPLIMRYEWLSESRSSIFVNIDRPLPAATSTSELDGCMNRLYSDVPTSAGTLEMSDYQPLFARGMSINKWWDYLLHLLHLAPGPFEGQNR